MAVPTGAAGGLTPVRPRVVPGAAAAEPAARPGPAGRWPPAARSKPAGPAGRAAVSPVPVAPEPAVGWARAVSPERAGPGAQQVERAGRGAQRVERVGPGAQRVERAGPGAPSPRVGPAARRWQDPAWTPPVDTTQAGSPPAACGSATSGVSTVSGARGIAVDRDGIMYFTRESGGRGYIGRVLPGAAPESAWFPIGPVGQPVAGSTPRVLRSHRQRGYLVVSDPGLQGGVAYTVNVAGPSPYLGQTTSAIPGIHGLAIAADGGVFISRGDGHIDRWMPDSYEFIYGRASTAPIFPAGQRVLGLAFGPDGQLYMGSSNGGIKRARVVQVAARDFRLMDVVDHGSFTGAANDLAVDVDGRVYVADHTGTTGTRLAIVPPGGTGAVQRIDAILGRLAGLAFGRGVLQCDDLYITDVGGPAFRYGVGRLALDLP